MLSNQDTCWWSWEWATIGPNLWYKRPIGDYCRKCGRSARSFPLRCPEDVIQEAADNPEGAGLDFRRLTEIEDGNRDQDFWPCAVVNSNFIYLEVAAGVDVVDTDTFAAKMSKPASIFANSNAIETKVWPFVNEVMTPNGVGAIAVEKGTVPEGVRKRHGRLGYRSEVQLLEYRLRPENQLRKEQAVEVFNMEKQKAIDQRSGLFSQDMVLNKVLSWDKWQRKIEEKEKALLEREKAQKDAWDQLNQKGKGPTAEKKDVVVSGAEHSDTLDLFGGAGVSPTAAPQQFTALCSKSKGKGKNKGKHVGNNCGSMRSRNASEPSPDAPRSSQERSRTPQARSDKGGAAPPQAHVPGTIIKPEAAGPTATPMETSPPSANPTVPQVVSTPDTDALKTTADKDSAMKQSSKQPRRESQCLQKSAVVALFDKTTGEDQRVMGPVRGRTQRSSPAWHLQHQCRNCKPIGQKPTLQNRKAEALNEMILGNGTLFQQARDRTHTQTHAASRAPSKAQQK